jgi:hypothetical protein
VIVAAGLCLLSAAAAHAQKGGKPAAKPKHAATPPSSTGVKSATQMAGDNGSLNVPYMLGPKNEELVVTLRGAEYSARSLNILNTGSSSDDMVTKADTKLLVLRYSVQNPQNRDMDFSWESLNFTAVDAKDTNHTAGWVARDGTNESLSLQLKPAQKLDVYTAISVPATGPVPKLIVQRGGVTPVLRYDLRGKVKPIPPPLADPSDASGATALREVKATPGTFYPTGVFDLRVDGGVTYLTKQPNGEDAEEGKRYAVVAVTIKNLMNGPSEYAGGAFEASVTTADGEKVEGGQFLKLSGGDEASGTLRPGEEAKARLVFAVPTAAAAKTLRIQEGGEGRAFLFDLSGK